MTDENDICKARKAPEPTDCDFPDCGCATPTHAWRDIAASAYRAYAASTGNKNFQGNPMPAFDDLPLSTRTAWEAAVRHVGDCLDSRELPDPSRWSGWVAP